jgi:hypothetical protein
MALEKKLWSRRYVPGLGWQPSQPFGASYAGEATEQRLGIDDAGNPILVWAQEVGSSSSIWSTRHVAGAGWQTAQLIETDDSGEARAPAITVDRNGNAIAIWRQSDGVRSNIWANFFQR